MQKSKFPKFILRFKAELLHELLQRVAVRAYERGREDALAGRISETPAERVKINPDHMRRFL